MNQASLDQVFSALADPTRRAILARLALGEASVGELAEPAVSRHLKVLEGAALITREKDAQWRRCRLHPEPLKEAADWISQYRKFWENQLDALAEYLEGMQNHQEDGDDRATDKKRDD